MYAIRSYYVRVIEGDKERIQQYQGVVIAEKGSGGIPDDCA